MKNYNCASHPHNLYIQWLAEGGILTLTFFIFYLYFFINYMNKNGGEKGFKILGIVIIIIMFWPIMSTGSLIKNWNGVLTFYILGICLCLSRFKKNY